MSIDGVGGVGGAGGAYDIPPPPRSKDQEELDHDLKELREAVAKLLGKNPQSKQDLKKYNKALNKVIDKVNEMMKKAYNAQPWYNPFTEIGAGNQMEAIFDTKTGICGNILKDDVSAQGSKGPHFFNPIVETDPPQQIDDSLLESAIKSLDNS